MSSLTKTAAPPSSSDTATASKRSDGAPELLSTEKSEIDSSADEGWDPPERYEEYGDWQDDYADAVGISRWREL